MSCLRFASFLALLVIWAESPQVFAQETEKDLRSDLAVCAAITENDGRLECLDFILAAYGIAGDQEALEALESAFGELTDLEEEEPPKGWQVETTLDPMSDLTVVTAVLRSDNNDHAFGPYQLKIICHNNKLFVKMFWWGTFREDPKVKMRFNKGQPFDMPWDKDSEIYAIQLAGIESEFIEALEKSTSLIMQAQPFLQDVQTAFFDLAGTKSALKPIHDICKISHTEN